MEDALPLIQTGLKAPRAGAIAGIVFSVLLIISLGLLKVSVPANPQDAGTWLAGEWKQVRLALSFLPFAGVAFLWFIGVIRDRMGIREDKFFSSVFLGSGLLFLAMLFTSAAVAGALLMSYGFMGNQMMETGIYVFGRTVAYEILNVYAMKMAAVFMISTCTLALRIGIFPRAMAFLGYAVAILILLSSRQLHWVPLAFPSWTLVISSYILIVNLRSKAA